MVSTIDFVYSQDLTLGLTLGNSTSPHTYLIPMILGSVKVLYILPTSLLNVFLSSPLEGAARTANTLLWPTKTESQL